MVDGKMRRKMDETSRERRSGKECKKGTSVKDVKRFRRNKD